jgi:hypothetical protein
MIVFGLLWYYSEKKMQQTVEHALYADGVQCAKEGNRQIKPSAIAFFFFQKVNQRSMPSVVFRRTE